MKASDVKYFIDHGFTKDEIMAMDDDLTAQSEGNSGESNDPDPDPEGDPTPDPDPEDNKGINDLYSKIDTLSKSLDALIKAQQSQNRAQSNTQRVTQSVDDILAGIINPNQNK